VRQRLSPSIATEKAALVSAFAQVIKAQLALGQALNVVPSAIVPMIDDLEALGAISRVPDEADRRRHGIQLTPKGAALLQQATLIALKVDDAILGSLAKEERDMLRRLLDKLSPRGRARAGRD
jgi:DNA-binding MarR family transcriptional regulator